MLASFFEKPFDPNRRLQHQIQERLIEAILAGVWPLHEPLPATRVFAARFKVSRNTISLVYERLAADGYLMPVNRRGYFINERALREQLTIRQDAKLKDSLPTEARPLDLEAKLRYRFTGQSHITKPNDWRRFEFPFVYGQTLADKTSVTRWRDCVRLAGTAQHAPTWISDLVDRDDPMLIDQIIRRVLPQRGFRAAPENILVTIGAQNAVYLAASLFCSPGSRVDIEDPGYVDARNIFLSLGASLKAHGVDTNGMRVTGALSGAEVVYVTPGHQSPTNVTMSMERRLALLAAADTHDFIIIEDDYEHELNFVGAQRPALKSFDRSDRVIHIGSLSKPLFPGLRLGFVAASSAIIEEMRVLRRLMYRHPPAQDQRAMALFLAEGHYDAHIRRQRKDLSGKWRRVFQEVDRLLPMCAVTQTTGGSAVWLQLPADLPARDLQAEAARNGVLVEAGDIHFLDQAPPKNCIRLGFGAVSLDQITPGLERLAQVITRMLAARRPGPPSRRPAVAIA
ncbi:aminotransferase-like domain-containing protein [Roseibium suaedae]|uniref:Transcriptional regulator, GntR family n=1 Tax=Roseibium suaedae TaxID=735517 RepID=A0A1M7PP12_9HYPH|nr:PLP-dependent aminotransferase family protein [Roseibium suaedae]SHN19064.1 transcriptional regulator, GntR family [Roseibium suaedae]